MQVYFFNCNLKQIWKQNFLIFHYSNDFNKVSYRVSISEYVIIRSWCNHCHHQSNDLSRYRQQRQKSISLSSECTLDEILSVWFDDGLSVSTDDVFCLFFLKCGSFGESQVWALKRLCRWYYLPHFSHTHDFLVACFCSIWYLRGQW